MATEAFNTPDSPRHDLQIVPGQPGLPSPTPSASKPPHIQPILASRLARAAVVAGSAIVCVLLGAVLVDIREIKIRGLGNSLNDQVGYIGVARNFLDSGHLHSTLIYPSLLGQLAQKDYLYMPGDYLALAAAYALFGFGAIQSVLPSMLAYVVASVALFFGVLELYGRDIATLAALLFVLFPANIVYALTAMPEMMVVCAAVIAFAIFVYLPFTLKVALGPGLLVLPLLFRETGVAIALIFAALVLFDHRRLRPWAALLFAVGSLAVVWLVLRSDISAGRPSLALLDIFSTDERSLYSDALALGRIHPTLQEWLRAPLVKLAHNGRLLAKVFSSAALAFVEHGALPQTGVSLLETTSLGLMLSGIPLGLVAIVRRPRDPLLFGAVAVLATLLTAILTLYFVLFFQAVRILLLAVPYECIVFAVLLRSLQRRMGSSPWRIASWSTRICLGLGVVGLASLGLTYAALAPDPSEQLSAKRDTAFLESIQHDDHYVLVAPWQLAFDYVYDHYPVTWAFLPANRETLVLLDATYPVGTILLPASGADTELTADEILKAGFEEMPPAVLEAERYEVFKRRTTDLALDDVVDHPE
jgi:hypothetical protein